VQAADLSPVPVEARTQSGRDLFLIGAGVSAGRMTVMVAVGAAAGAALVALLAPVGSRLGVPTMIAARAPLGYAGAQVVALVLFVTNFAWIAVNNAIAASVAARLLPLPVDARAWSVVAGLVSTAVVAAGPDAVRRADRWAVPLMAVAGVTITWSVLSLPPAGAATDPMPALSLAVGLDIVVGYQVSWLLMFADYSRFTASGRTSGWAVFLGLTLTAWWLMPMGWRLAQHVGSADPGTMLAGARGGVAAAVLIMLATITTNFVNVYLSSLAWRSVMPAVPDRAAVWIVGAIGTALGLTGGWLDRFAGFMTVVGSVLVPAGGVFLAHFVVARRQPSVPDLYDPHGPARGVRWPGMIAWAAGVAAYYAAPAGATIAGLAVALVVYLAWSPRGGRAARPRSQGTRDATS
jgi:cytosine permease